MLWALRIMARASYKWGKGESLKLQLGMEREREFPFLSEKMASLQRLQLQFNQDTVLVPTVLPKRQSKWDAL